MKISRNEPDENRRKQLRTILKSKLTGIKEPTLISSERLLENMATLHCFNKHRESDNSRFPIFDLCKELKSIGNTPNITICLRDPVRHLRSRYCWNKINGQSQRLRGLSPTEFIEKQATLERASRFTSILSYTCHSELLKKLQKHAFVKAFGFQELLASDDVFSLMGLQGEDKYAFRDFPRENKLAFTKEQEKEIEIEITQALKQYGFYERIMKAQMFE